MSTTTITMEQVQVAAPPEPQTEELPVIKLANEHALVFGHSAVWSPSDNQLVAASLVATSSQTMKAIMATLATNSLQFINLYIPGETVVLQNARRGFIHVGASLEKVNSKGTVQVILHPAAGDPRLAKENYFYLVDDGEQNDFPGLFAERLNTAITWPVKPEWADYLLQAGMDTHLVEGLPCIGPDFVTALRVLKSDDAWADVIAAGITGGQIAF